MRIWAQKEKRKWGSNNIYQINTVTIKNQPILHTGEEKIADLGHAIEELSSGVPVLITRVPALAALLTPELLARVWEDPTIKPWTEKAKAEFVKVMYAAYPKTEK